MIPIQEKCLVQSYLPGGALGPREFAPWIGSAVFAGLTGVTDTQTDRQLDRGADHETCDTRRNVPRLYNRRDASYEEVINIAQHYAPYYRSDIRSVQTAGLNMAPLI